jgi:raffinose/stachyose/melibiose transport system substrate-binding protein
VDLARRVLMVAGGIALVLAGCGGGTTPSSSRPAASVPAEPSGPASTAGAGAIGTPLAGALTMWDIPESDVYTAWWEEYIASFQDANPGVTVDLEIFPSEDYKTKIQSAIVAGTAPDIFYAIPGPRYYEAATQGRMLALDEYVAPETFTTATREACTVDGALYCVPLYLAPSYVYYNTAHFQAAGVDPATWANPEQPTWEEFTAACDALKASGVAPIGVGNGDSWPGLFFYWAFQNRHGGVGAFRDAMDGTNGGTFAGPSFIKAGQLTQELASKGYFQEGFNGVAGDAKYALFTQGDAAMIYMGPWMLGTIASEAPEDFEFGYFAFPSFSDGDPASQTDVMAGVDALWVSSSTAAPDAAGAFLAGFAEPEAQLDFSLDTQSVAATTSVAESATDDAEIIRMAKLAESATNAFPWWDNALAPEVANVMLGNSQALLAGEMSPEAFGQAMDEAAGR